MKIQRDRHEVNPKSWIQPLLLAAAKQKMRLAKGLNYYV